MHKELDTSIAKLMAYTFECICNSLKKREEIIFTGRLFNNRYQSIIDGLTEDQYIQPSDGIGEDYIQSMRHSFLAHVVELVPAHYWLPGELGYDLKTVKWYEDIAKQVTDFEHVPIESITAMNVVEEYNRCCDLIERIMLLDQQEAEKEKYLEACTRRMVLFSWVVTNTRDMDLYRKIKDKPTLEEKTELFKSYSTPSSYPKNRFAPVMFNDMHQQGYSMSFMVTRESQTAGAKKFYEEEG